MTKKRCLLFLAIILCLCSVAKGAPIDDLETMLRDNSQVQEKVYVHTDNSAYFVGDTLWYKAYVVRADDLKPTNMSKLLYVELLTPDGYLVERQHIVVNSTGYTCGQFILNDSLYSGFYEIRAYTRWQLNFNAKVRKFSREESWKFFGKQAVKEFYRDWDGLYSRVLPVYQKPTEAGNYMDRYMAHRPKTRVFKDKEFITMTFYPEGGELIEGVPCNVAFELKDNHGECLDIEGTLSDGKKIKPQRMGMGQVTVTPGATPLKATFNWKGKDYTFTLPKASKQGVTLSYNPADKTALITAKGVKPAAYAVLCRGSLMDFERLSSNKIQLQTSALTTGVSELVIYDDNAQPLASRLFFVNKHDLGKTVDVTLTYKGAPVDRKTTIEPYAPLDVAVSVPVADAEWKGAFSLAVRDAQTDERGYNTGNIMTDMLLSSDLKGFIAYPDYYFEGDDAQHQSDLDLLMKVQGWRKYKRAEELRYTPETGLTFEGTVYTVPAEAGMLEYEDLANVGKKATTVADLMRKEQGIEAFDAPVVAETETVFEPDGTDVVDTENLAGDGDSKSFMSGRIGRNVLVEAEINKNGEIAGAIARTDRNGRFCINMPPFYGWAYLMAKAYTRSDSVSKNMQTGKLDKDFLSERAYPDFYVKQDVFFPRFTKPYSWYQTNSPQLLFVDEDDDENIPETSKLAGMHQLQTVVVKSRRRGRRGIDMSKPAIVMDAYDLYNEMTDRGLSYGVVDFRMFPDRAATCLFGNMGRGTQMNIRALVKGTSFYRNYTPGNVEYDKNVSQAEIFNTLRLERMQYVKAYTDYELRTDSGDVFASNIADVTFDFVPIENDGRRPTYRDRRYIMDGIARPEEFYSPDYSNAKPKEPKDYRRTLYWNPNVKLGADGTFRTTIYNNSRETRVTVSAAGLDTNGQMYYK